MIPGNLLLLIKNKTISHMRGGNASIMDMIGSYNKSRLLFSSALHVCESGVNENNDGVNEKTN